MNLPRWMQSKTPRPGTPEFTSMSGEAELASELGGKRRAMSGAGAAKYDVETPIWLIDSKESAKKSHAVNHRALLQLEKKALSEGKRPMYAITFWDPEEGLMVKDEPWVVVRLCDVRLKVDQDPQPE